MSLFPRRPPLALLLGALVFTLAPFHSATAQETRGTIFGTVKDPSGAVLAGMSVVITNEDTNVSNETEPHVARVLDQPRRLPDAPVRSVPSAHRRHPVQ